MTLEEFKESPDWLAAFDTATCGDKKYLPIEEVVEVFASDIEYGDYAETDCLAIVRCQNGNYAKVWASCDTTGWD